MFGVARKQRQRAAFFLSRGRAQRNAPAQRLQPAAQHIVMLLGQNLRGRHERGLIASLYGQQHRRDGDHGFSRTDVALQQTIHRMICREIALDFRDDFLLRPSEFEWKRFEKSVEHCARSAVRLANTH